MDQGPFTTAGSEHNPIWLERLSIFGSNETLFSAVPNNFEVAAQSSLLEVSANDLGLHLGRQLVIVVSPSIHTNP